jgi:hypothetical protein
MAKKYGTEPWAAATKRLAGGHGAAVTPRVVALIRAGAQTAAVNAIGRRFHGAREIVHDNIARKKITAEVAGSTRAKKFNKTFQTLAEEITRISARHLAPRGESRRAERAEYVNAHSESRNQLSMLIAVRCVLVLARCV